VQGSLSQIKKLSAVSATNPKKYCCNDKLFKKLPHLVEHQIETIYLIMSGTNNQLKNANRVIVGIRTKIV
jgi:hypothetical protein